MQSLNKRRITHVCFFFFAWTAWWMHIAGVEGVLCDQSNQRVTVKGNVQPQRVLKRVKKIKKRSDFWLRSGDSRAMLQQQQQTPAFSYSPSSHSAIAQQSSSTETYWLDPNLPTRSPTDHIRYHSRPNNRVLPLHHLSLANCTSPILRDFLNMTGLKRLCEPAKFEIFAEF